MRKHRCEGGDGQTRGRRAIGYCIDDPRREVCQRRKTPNMAHAELLARCDRLERWSLPGDDGLDPSVSFGDRRQQRIALVFVDEALRRRLVSDALAERSVRSERYFDSA
jgi:hypothetical protein